MKNVFRLALMAVALFAFGTLAFAQTVIPAGSDHFVTPADGSTYHDLNQTFAAGTFGPGSLDTFIGRVSLQGNPGTAAYDTRVERLNSVTVPAGGSATINLVVRELNLKSIDAVVVDYADGSQVKWDVFVGLSTSVASKGTMTVTSAGGFSSKMTIAYAVTFAPSPGFANRGLEPFTLDIGSPIMQAKLRAEAEELVAKAQKGEITQSELEQTTPCAIEVKKIDKVPVEVGAAAPVPAGCGVTITQTGGTWVICGTCASGRRFCITSRGNGHLAAILRHWVTFRLIC